MSAKAKQLALDEKVSKATTIIVGLVAAFAAIMSYVHIKDVVLRYHYDALTAYLCPLSIDGLIVGCSLLMIAAYRNRLRASVALFGMWLGIGATVAANVAYGLPHGVIGALPGAWPAIALIVLVHAVEQMAKRKRKSKQSSTTGKRDTKPRVRAETIVDSNGFQPNNLPAPNGQGPITAYRIRKLINCNQAKAAELAAIMNDDHVDLVTATQTRDERMGRHGARA
jgi:Protein of unknown function (DUF2637)